MVKKTPWFGRIRSLGDLYFNCIIREVYIKIDHYDDLAFIGFLIMITAQLIQDILNEKYFTKYSKKVKNGIIVFIVIITIGVFYLLIKP